MPVSRLSQRAVGPLLLLLGVGVPRNLSSGANGTVGVNLVPPGARYGDRVNQLDLRLARTFSLAHTTVKGMMDFYNLTNGNTVLLWNNTFGTDGSSWLLPRSILSARLIKLGVQC